ncbi:MAG: bifunctional folylpolyglutamate synthase/dihydrofolate synthase [Pyrinomonadaceae bacterium]
MTFDEAVQYLLSLGHETLAIKLGLDNVRRLLDALGRPEDSYPLVQIAGTNGKGSTAAMLAAVCRAASVRAGLYTSPHLISLTERVSLNGASIAPADFARHTTTVRDAALKLNDVTGALPTFFEQVTAVALVAFRETGVQLAILETGLGGRLDATTAAGAQTAAITPVALDHQEYLGHTLAEIAAEKAAIVHGGTRAAVISPAQPSEALRVILARCREVGVRPRLATERIQVHSAEDRGRLRATFQTEQDVYPHVLLALRGRHQLSNAVTAIALAEALREQGFALTRAAIIEGVESARHPGRLELVPGAPPILFDGAHNPAGARALRAYLDEFAHAPVTLVFGAMADKDLAQLASTLFPAADQIILTRPSNPRAARPDKIARFVPTGFDSHKVSLADDVGDALRRAREQTHDGLVCVTGSLYLVGEAKAWLAGES